MGGPGFIGGKAYFETDNFFPCKFKVNGVEYYSAENYFQCAKTVTKGDHEMLRKSGTGVSVWSAGRHVKLRKDWESVKVKEMYVGNKHKFEQNPDIAEKLISSDGPVVFNGSTGFWNKWNGLIIERIRAELRKDGEKDEKRAKEVEALMQKYENEN